MSRKSLVPVNVPALSSAPTTPTLRAGDLYFNTNDNILYSYTGSEWVASAAAGSGATGPTGPAGEAGATGATGATGPTGPAGEALINIDAGTPTSVYGGIDPIDAGTVNG